MCRGKYFWNFEFTLDHIILYTPWFGLCILIYAKCWNMDAVELSYGLYWKQNKYIKNGDLIYKKEFYYLIERIGLEKSYDLGHYVFDPLMGEFYETPWV